MSAMTEIRDRLLATGDDEAATALDVAMRAAQDRLEVIEDLSRKLEEARGKIEELERDFAKLQSPEGVHINMLSGKIAKISMMLCAHTHGEEAVREFRAKDARIAELEAAIKPFAELAADTHCDDHYCVLVTNVTNPETHLHVSDLRRAAAAYVRIVEPSKETIEWAEGVFAEEDAAGQPKTPGAITQPKSS